MKEKKFAPVEAVSDLTLPSDLATREERYPATISFPDQELAIVANGYGLLSMFITGNRSMNSPWKVSFSPLFYVLFCWLATRKDIQVWDEIPMRTPIR